MVLWWESERDSHYLHFSLLIIRTANKFGLTIELPTLPHSRPLLCKVVLFLLLTTLGPYVGERGPALHLFGEQRARVLSSTGTFAVCTPLFRTAHKFVYF